MSFYQIVLLSGSLLAAMLFLHHFAAIKVDNDAILSAYRDLRKEANRKAAEKSKDDSAPLAH